MKARDVKRLIRLQKPFAKISLLIIDELGFVPPATVAEFYAAVWSVFTPQLTQARALDRNLREFEVIGLSNNYHMAVIHSCQYHRIADGNYKARKEEYDAVKAALGMMIYVSYQIERVRDLDKNLIHRPRHCTAPPGSIQSCVRNFDDQL